MKILVTGGAGFIGSHLVDALIKSEHDVIMLDNLHTGNQAHVNQKAMFYRMDMTDHTGLAQVFDRNEIQAVYHLAARANVRESMQDPLGYAEVNVMATLSLMELARQAGVEQFIFASTGGAVYGEGLKADGTHRAFEEKDAVNPLDNYAVNKLAIEYHLQAYAEAYDFRCATLRLANAYGPRQNPKGEAGVVAIFAGAMLANQEVHIHGDGEQARDFCYVSDMVEAFLSALRHKATGIYNIGTGQPVTISQIFTKLASITHYSRKPTYLERPVGEVDMNYLDTTKARMHWGWSDRVDLQQGLLNVVKSLRER